MSKIGHIMRYSIVRRNRRNTEVESEIKNFLQESNLVNIIQVGSQMKNGFDDMFDLNHIVGERMR